MVSVENVPIVPDRLSVRTFSARATIGFATLRAPKLIFGPASSIFGQLTAVEFTTTTWEQL